MQPTRIRTRLLAAGLALLALYAGVVPARASTNLRGGLAEVAKDIAKLLKSRGFDSIAVGQFTGPANFPTSSGPGIAKTLSEELEKAGVAVKQRAKLGIRGQYLVTQAPLEQGAKEQFLAVRLKGTVEDEFGKVITDFSFDRTIQGEAAFTGAMGTTVDLDPSRPTRGVPPDVDRDNKLRDSLSKPKVHLAGNLISASPTSPYAVEILVNGKPQPARNDEGLAFVKINRGDTYAVRLINRSPHEAAVALAIDGLSMFTFSEYRYTKGESKGQPLYSRVIVPAQSSTLIQGWHKNNKVSDSFLVTEYAKGAAASLQQTANIGTITATFSAAWPEGKRPQDEPAFFDTTGDATGFGPPVDARFTEVRREVGITRATVSVRYTK